MVTNYARPLPEGVARRPRHLRKALGGSGRGRVGGWGGREMATICHQTVPHGPRPMPGASRGVSGAAAFHAPAPAAPTFDAPAASLEPAPTSRRACDAPWSWDPTPPPPPPSSKQCAAASQGGPAPPPSAASSLNSEVSCLRRLLGAVVPGDKGVDVWKGGRGYETWQVQGICSYPAWAQGPAMGNTSCCLLACMCVCLRA